MPEALNSSILGWFRSICALVLLACLVTGPAGADESTSPSFRLIGQTSLMAAGSAQSTGFRLQSCIDTSPSGISSSTSFRLGSACMPLRLAAAGTPPITGPSSQSQSIPLFDGWKVALLMLVLALLAWPSRGGRRIV